MNSNEEARCNTAIQEANATGKLVTWQDDNGTRYVEGRCPICQAARGTRNLKRYQAGILIEAAKIGDAYFMPQAVDAWLCRMVAQLQDEARR